MSNLHQKCRSTAYRAAGDLDVQDTQEEVLPSASLAGKLVDYHLQNLSWYHNVLHTPTFLTQCKKFWNYGTAPHDQWIAVYCAVLSSAAWTLSNSSPNDDCLTADMVELAEGMMRQTRAVLYRSDFLGRHSIWAVQAICVVNMVAHSFGESDLMATLVNAGVRVAQCLGLHRIPDEGTVVSSAEEAINPKSFSTRMPLNSDYDRLVDRDTSVLTISTCAVIMSKIARLMPDILEGTYATDRDETAKYQQVILADRRMRELVATLPAVTLRKQGASQEPQYSWIATARRTLAISAADKVSLNTPVSFLRSS
ncbi:hypothetical protein KC323_g8221 [Hortaea werneckii]|nr:hypothetical protein KC323_g8221 [Hortaea werneckii]